MVFTTVTKITTTLVMMLFLAACGSSQEAAPDANAGNTVSSAGQSSGPRAGTLEEFMVTVGDRVFFRYGSSHP